MLHHQLAWYVGGPVLGLCVVALRLLLNGRLSVTGGYSVRVRALLTGEPVGWVRETPRRNHL